MKDKTYDLIKLWGTIILPALITLYGIIGSNFNIPYTEQVLAIGTGLVTCITTILQKISNEYFSKNNIIEAKIEEEEYEERN